MILSVVGEDVEKQNLYYWWEWESEIHFRKQFAAFTKTGNIHTTPISSFPEIHVHLHQRVCAKICVVFVISPNSKEPKRPSIMRWKSLPHI